MTFARKVFSIAGAWGVIVLTALYFMAETVPVTAGATGAQFYFGFLAVTMAWQFAFFMIASDPVRFRPMMLAAIVEKVAYVVTMTVLYAQSRVGWAELSTAVPDVVLGGLFVAAFVRTRASSPTRSA